MHSSITCKYPFHLLQRTKQVNEELCTFIQTYITHMTAHMYIGEENSIHSGSGHILTRLQSSDSMQYGASLLISNGYI